MLELPGYKIEKQIVKSGKARFYLALHEGLQCKVAIKVISKHPDEDLGISERFMREASIVANLNQQNIVTVYDLNVYHGYHYIAMERLLGDVTLDHKIKQGISQQSGLETIKQVAAAIGYAHSKGIVHGDVKPENIMYREDDSAVLTQFGTARSTSSATKMTATDTVTGTSHYMSPEQANGQEPGPSADIYSLGVVLYEVLTGNIPYDVDPTVAVISKHISKPIPKLEGEQAIYQPVLNCMMAKDKKNRYQNCDEIIADIDSLMTGGDASNASTIINKALQATVKQHARKPAVGTQELKRKQKLLIAAVTAGVIVVASAGGFIIYEQNQAEKEQHRLAELDKQKGQKLQDEKLLLEKKQAEEKAAALKVKQDEAKRLAEQKIAAEEKAKQLVAQKNAKEEKAKQLAALELKKKEARQAKLKAERDKARREIEKKISDLFAKAESQLQNNQLKDAYQSFQDIRNLDRENAKAKSGITRVADRYIALAITSAIANDFDKANDYIRSVIQIAPTHDRLASTQQEIIDLKKAQLADTEPDEPDKKPHPVYRGF